MRGITGCPMAIFTVIGVHGNARSTGTAMKDGGSTATTGDVTTIEGVIMTGVTTGATTEIVTVTEAVTGVTTEAVTEAADMEIAGSTL